MELITRTARLVPYAKRPKQVPSFVTAYSYTPEVDDSALRLGSIFAVIEVLVSGRPGEDVASLIIGALQTAYYNEPDAETDPLTRFEQATKAINATLSDHVNQGNAAWIGKLSAVIAVQCGEELHLSHTGSTEAYLYRHQAATRITSGPTDRPTGPAKTFGSIASGHLEAGDQLLLATPALIHQVSLTKLHAIVGTNSPNTAMAELTDILKGSDSTRIAALVIEITTPELAALQVRTDHPDDVTIGTPETPLEAAKLIATPIAQATVATSKRAGAAARDGWNQHEPKLRRAGLKTASLIRASLSGERLARRATTGLLAVIVVAVGLVWHHSSTVAKTKLVNRYIADVTRYQATSTIASDDTKRTNLIAVAGDIKSLSPGNTNQLNTLLKTAKLPTGAPTTVAGLQSAVTDALNTLDGLIIVHATTVANFNSIKNAAPGNFELSGGNLYVTDSTNSAIYVVNITTNVVTKSSADTSKLGKTVATTLASTGDGMYILTAAPSVWFYRFAGGSLSQMSLGLSGWESATSIASYGGNLYLLSGGQVLKHVRTSTGFSPGTAYFSGPSTVPSPTALAVDGYVYVAGADGLYQYLSGAVKASVPARSGLTSLSSLRSAGSDSLVGVDRASGRIGLWSETPKLTYVHQIQLSGTNTISDSLYNPTTKQYYAIADGKIVSFSAPN